MSDTDKKLSSDKSRLASAPAPGKKKKRTPGRARSDTSRLAILNATLKLLETQSLQQLSIEAIAKEAGVGKATIYRWWPSKASVVIDAFIHNHLIQTPMRRGVNCREAIATHINLLISQYSSWPGRIVGQILGEGQSDPEILREFREKFWYGRRAIVKEVIEEGRRNGEFRTDGDIELEMDILYAPIYFRLLMGHLPLDSEFSKMLTESVLDMLQPEVSKSGKY